MDWLGSTRARAVMAGALFTLGLCACADRTVEAPGQPAAPSAQSAPAPALDTQPGAFSEAGLAAIDARLNQLVDNGDRSGVVMMLARDGEIEHVATAGYADIADETPMRADTPVRIASMTKPITAAAILILVEDGVLELDDPVSDYIPAFAEARVATSLQIDEAYELPTATLERALTIEDLLTHTSGIGYVFDYQTDLGALYISEDIYQGAADYTMAERMETLAGLPLYFQPGERWHYSYANDVLGHVIEVAAGESLEAFMQARIFTPLGMEDTTFFPDEALMARLATLYTHNDVGDMVAVEGAADAVRNAPFAAGGAGLISTAEDYMRFARMLAAGGVLDGVRVLSQDSVDQMTTPHVPLEKMPASMAGANMAFGYSVSVIVDGPGAHPFRRVGDYGWGGYFDTGFVISPASGVIAVVMAQEQPGPSTPDTTSARDVFEPLAYGALPSDS